MIRYSHGCRLACLLFIACANAVIAPAVSAAECKKVVISADPAYPPLHWYDGKTLQGASIEIAARVFHELDIPYEIRYVGPWSRVLHSAELGEIDVIATLKMTPERLGYLEFTSHPAFANPVAVFVPRNSKLHYSKWDDLIGLRGGITRGNKFGNGFDEFLEVYLTIDGANLPESSFKKMAIGRIDYFITGLYTGLAYIAEHGQESEFTALTPYVVETQNRMGFVKNSPCIKYLPAFDKRLGEMQRQGATQVILDRNLERWRVLSRESKKAH
ncbi:substrate-binding periplasmic protein [Undibacterium sp.]|uniref:substrate-binding periplasmic protein n=1 Tax=Undibacterium sp. TaxID=1914977 RepID=UPI002BC4F679|nr:transporter substrate-binding domain-containing protein [Undibacterium sp.]HTD07198.1 transporter substrate-binding domain-containing protein [Undibacterium sp.]